MELILKLDNVNDLKEEDLNTLISLKDRGPWRTKITTTKKEIEYDRKDNRNIKSLRNVKLVFKIVNGGCLIFLGNLQVDFKKPYGGAFFCKRVIQETTDFEDVKGVEARIMFTSIGVPSSIDVMQKFLSDLVNDPMFEFNIGQFDEFLELFNFYKRLSDEINNNKTYTIILKSHPYYFISSDIKEFDSIFASEIKDQNGVLVGYKFNEDTYLNLNNELQQYVRKLIDIHIEGNSSDVARIKRIGSNNIYLSNFFRVNEKNESKIKSFNLVNIQVSNKEIILSGEFKNEIDYEEDYEYLNLYDMGQKIKIESIDNSLRLIKQGATGAATELLEYLIGDKEMPNFSAHSLQTSPTLRKYMEGLNESQKEAFLLAIDRSPVSLIKGPPGTGKTHVINAIVQYITKELKDKVIVSSQTHVAIDNVLDKLISHHDLIIPNRITNRKNKYSGEEIDKTLYRTWGLNFEENNTFASNTKLASKISESIKNFKGSKRFIFSEENALSDYSVIGATTTTSAIGGKKGLEVLKGYDWLIIDEVSKCPITEVLRYLPYVKRIIMVGDDFQLSPLLEFNKSDVKDFLKSHEDEEMFDKLQTMYEQSVFAKVMEKAKKANRLVVLNENYRSVRQVLNTYNVFYDGQLISKRETVKPEKISFKSDQNENYLNDYDVFFIEVKGGQEAKEGHSRFNMEELKATALFLEKLLKDTNEPEKVTVSAIFPYAAQINLFQKNNLNLINQCKKTFKSFEIDTVDAFQGRETDIVLVNTVVTDSSQRNFLSDFRRINVSMSRSRDKLFIFGNSITLKRINMKISGGYERHYFKEIIEYIESNGHMYEYKGELTHANNHRKSTIELA